MHAGPSNARKLECGASFLECRIAGTTQIFSDAQADIEHIAERVAAVIAAQRLRLRSQRAQSVPAFGFFDRLVEAIVRRVVIGWADMDWAGNTLAENAALPRWGAMWLLAVAIYGALKLTSWLKRDRGTAPAWRHACYLLAWPGMDADAFLFGNRAKRPTLGEWAFALAKFTAGLVILLVVVSALLPAMTPGITTATTTPTAPVPADSLHEYLVGWLGMLGIVLVLHFGLFHVLSCAYRQAGIDAVPIMNWPLTSRGVSEFWGQRWNLAFRDLTHRLLFRPTVRRLGPVGALVLAFLVSGVVHDAVISLPAGGGYGLPTVFFLIQAAAILLERGRWGRAAGLGHGVRGWLFCLAALLLPCPLLFHPPFVLRVVVPFLHALGGV